MIDKLLTAVTHVYIRNGFKLRQLILVDFQNMYPVFLFYSDEKIFL